MSRSNPLYRLKVRISPASGRIEGEVRIQRPPASAFHLNGNLEIRGMAADGRSASFHKEPSSRVVVEADCHEELQVDYGGCLKEIMHSVNMIQPDLVELALYSAWYPLMEGDRPFDFELEADLPSDFIPVTNGRLGQRKDRGDGTLTRWKSSQPGFDVALIACPRFHSVEGRLQGMTVEMFYDQLPKEYALSKAEGLVKGMGRLSGLYGPPRVEGQLRVVHSPRGDGGYSRIPLIVVSEAYTLALLKEAFGGARDFHGTAHEMAHFWWMIASFSTPDDWINEGLAEFSAFRLSHEQFGQDFADALVSEYREHASESQTEVPIAETENESPDRYVNRYEKTTLLFLEAQRCFGQEPLDRVLKALHARFSGTRNATTALFLQEVTDQLGPEARAFFEEALFRRRWSGEGGSSR